MLIFFLLENMINFSIYRVYIVEKMCGGMLYIDHWLFDWESIRKSRIRVYTRAQCHCAVEIRQSALFDQCWRQKRTAVYNVYEGRFNTTVRRTGRAVIMGRSGMGETIHGGRRKKIKMITRDLYGHIIRYS